MSFAYTVDKKGVEGSKKVYYGTYTSSGGSTGGDIVTGLRLVYDIILTPVGSSADASAPTVNATLGVPISGNGTVTIVTVANATGVWKAVGK